MVSKVFLELMFESWPKYISLICRNRLNKTAAIDGTLLSPSNTQVSVTTGIIESGITEGQVMLVLYEESKGVRKLLCIGCTLGKHSPLQYFKSHKYLLLLKQDSSSLVPYCLLDFFYPRTIQASHRQDSLLLQF